MLPLLSSQLPLSTPRQSATPGPQTLSTILANITADDINAAERCGGGGFGDVYMLSYATIGKLALKRVRTSGNQHEVDSQIRRATREAETWRRLAHPNILPFLDIFEHSGNIYPVSPFVENGSISDFTRRHPDVDRARLIQEAAAGIAYLHRSGIVHGDIKGANILVSDDVHSLLCDFGLAREQQNNTSTEMQGIGTVRWQSPELLRSGAGKTFKSDIWAFAMTIYEILSGHIPYHQCDSVFAVIIAVMLYKQRPPKEPATSPTGASYARLWDVAVDCWNEDPEKRPEIQEAHDRLLSGGLQSSPLPRHDEGARTAPIAPSPPSLDLSKDSQPTQSSLDTGDSGWVHVELGVVERPSSSDQAISLVRGNSNTAAVSAEPRRLPKSGVLGRHGRKVYSVWFSPDGKTIASGSWDHTLLLWDVEAGRSRGEAFRGHTDVVSCVAFSPDGATIASGSDDSTLRFWDVEAGTQKGEPLQGHTVAISCLAYSPDGTTIASGSRDYTIRLWDVEARHQRGVPLKGHTRSVECVAFSPDGTTIASGSWDKTIILWDPEAGVWRGEPLRGHTSAVRCLAFSPDGITIASGSNDSTIRFWDVEAGSQRGEPLMGHTSTVSCLAFSPDGGTVASGSDDQTLRFWDTEARSQRGEPLEGHTGEVSCLSYSPDGTAVASGNDDGIIRLWTV